MSQFKYMSHGTLRLSSADSSGRMHPSFNGELRYIDKGAALFKFFNHTDEVTITIQLDTSRGGRELGNAHFTLPKGESTYVLINDFPSGPHGSYAKCYCEMWVVRDPSKEKSQQNPDANVAFEIYERK
jgi:hypothetical protein